MAAKWSEIINDKDYQALSQKDKMFIQQRYYDNVISNDADYLALPQSEQILVKNKFFSQGAIGQDKKEFQEDLKLFAQMSGRMPSKILPPRRAADLGVGAGPGPIQRNPQFDIELQRRQAYNRLRKRYAPEQIKFILDVNKKIKAPPTAGRGIGGAVGSIGLPLLVGLAIPAPEEIITWPAAAARAIQILSPYVGAGLGGALGEAVQTGIEEKRIATRGELLKAAGKELVLEGATRGIVHAGKFAFSPFIKRTIPEAAALAEDFAKFGGVFDPTALDKRLSISIAMEVARGGFATKEVFEEMGKKSGKAGVLYAEHFLDLMANSTARMGKEQLGREFAEGVSRPTGFVFKQIDDIIDGLYKRLDDLVDARFKRVFKTVRKPTEFLDEFGKPITKETRKVVGKKLTAKLSPGFEELEKFVPVGVKTRKLKRFWLEVLKENKKALKLGKKGAFTLTPAAIAEGENVIKNLGDVIPHRTMRNIRSKVLRDIKKLHMDVNQDEALIKRFEKITFETLTDPDSVKGMTPDIQNLFNNTRNLYASMRTGTEDIFPEKLIDRVLKNPANITAEIFPKNNPTAIRRLRKALIEPIQGVKNKKGEYLWNQLRTSWFEDAVEQATKENVIKPHIFENLIKRRLGKKALEEMVPDNTGKRQLRNIRTLLEAMSKKPAAGASLFIRGAQVGGFYYIYDGWKDGDFLKISAGAALVMGPRFFAKMAAHPLGNSLIRKGISLEPGSSALVPVTARLVNLARQIDKQEQKKIIRMKKQIERGRELLRTGPSIGVPQKKLKGTIF